MHIHHGWEGEAITAHFICDQCGEIITSGQDNYIYEPGAPNAPTYFVHTGKCDALLQQRLGLIGKPWDHVSALIKRLAESLGKDSKGRPTVN